jgi:hypothetical protein
VLLLKDHVDLAEAVRCLRFRACVRFAASRRLEMGECSVCRIWPARYLTAPNFGAPTVSRYLGISTPPLPPMIKNVPD